MSVRRRHPHLLAALREELDVTSPKDGCSPSGQCGCCTVLIDGKAVVVVPARRSTKVAGQRRSSRSRASTPSERDGVRRRVRRVRRPAVRVLHPGHRDAGQGADRQEGRRPRPRGHGAATSAPTSAAAPATSRSSTRSRPSPRARRVDAALLGARSASAAPSTRPHELALGDRGYVDDIRVPGMLHAALHLTDHARADIAAIDTVGRGGRRPASSRVFTAADIPGELRVGHHPQGLAGDDPGRRARTSYAGDVLAIVVAETREQARAAAAAGRGRLRRAPRRSPTRSPRSTDAPSRRVGHRRQRAVASAPTPAATSTPRWPRSAHTVHEVFQTQRIEHAFLEPESTLAVPRATATDGTLHVYSGGQGVWDDRDHIAAVLGVDHRRRSPSSSSPTAARSAARRT